jgi:CRISPR-associated protein Cas2
MSSEQETLVSYDVSDNKSRRLLQIELKKLGLFMIQKSVMWGKLTKSEQRAVQRFFKEYLRKNDKAFLITGGSILMQIKNNNVGHRVDIESYMGSWYVI